MTNHFRNILCLSVLVLLVQTVPVGAQAFELDDQNSSVGIDPTSQDGMLSWFVDSGDFLNQQWFWYRIGSSGPESSIDTVSVPVVTMFNGTRGASVLYSNDIITVEVDYLLTGGAPDSGRSDITESVRITNLTQSPLDFHFFQYSDFDLTGNDSVQLMLGPNQYILARQSGDNVLSETVNTPAASHGEAAVFPFTRNRLNDGSPTILNDVTSAGPNDVTWALEWDTTIDPNGTLLISSDKRLEIVPEPSTWTLFSTAVIFYTVLKRRKPA